jgi:hypothetical protein
MPFEDRFIELRPADAATVGGKTSTDPHVLPEKLIEAWSYWAASHLSEPEARGLRRKENSDRW